MKNLFKIIFLLCLTMFVATSCSDSSNSSSSSGNNTENSDNSDMGNGDGDENTGGDDKPDVDNPDIDNPGGDTPGEPEIVKSALTKLINVGHFAYAETVGGKNYIWGAVGEIISDNSSTIQKEPFDVPFKVTYSENGCILLDNSSLYRTYYEDETTYKTEYVGTMPDKVKKAICGITQYVLTDDNRLLARGDNYFGQIGDNTNVFAPDFKEVSGIAGNIKDVVVSGQQNQTDTVYVLTDTGLYSWGENSNGQVGSNTTTDTGVWEPAKVEIDGKIQKIIANVWTAYALMEDGSLYIWGDNTNGQIGDNSTDKSAKPKKVEEIGVVKDVLVGGDVNGNSTVYASTDDNLYAWGYNRYGQIGNNATLDVTKPNKVNDIEGIIKEIIFSNNTVYVLTDKGLYAWGDNSKGQVGIDGVEKFTKPHKVGEVGSSIKKVVARNNTVYTLMDNGSLYTWGSNQYGQIGNGTTENTMEPYQVEIKDDYMQNIHVKDVIFSGYTVYAITKDDVLYSWGNNTYGQAGYGTTENAKKPYEVIFKYD